MASAVLSEIAWDDGFAIPVANARNKALEEELQRKLKKKANIENELSQHEDRISAMTEHMKDVKQELSHTQALCMAREKEEESEMHFKALAEREMGRLRQELAQLENELGSLRERKNTRENNIFKATRRIEELKSRLNWDQQALDTWLEESARKDEDTMAIIKYAHQDESRIRELTLSIERLTQEANQKRKTLDNQLTETIMTQVAVDKTTEIFRQANLERQELIHQWENTIEQMRKRDQEMQQCALMLAESNHEIREREALIKEKKNFLSGEVENNKECEREITIAERQFIRLQQQLQEQESSRMRVKDELETLKGTVDRAATEVESMRSKLTSVKKDITGSEVVLLASPQITKISDSPPLLDQNKCIALYVCSQDDIRCVSKETEKTGAEKRDLTTKIEELTRFSDTMEKELKKLHLQKQDNMIDNNILRMVVKRLRDHLYSGADGMFSLEKRQLQLQTAMKERQEEIRLHREMLTKQLKITDQERQGLSAEVHERLSKIDKIKKRYEILITAMAPPEGEEDKSQAYYIIKAAQEREELQRKGDELDAQIRKSEKEITAMENTFHVINNRNATYRKSSNKVTESSPEYQEKMKLDEQKRAAEEKYKHKRRQIRELQEDIQVSKKRSSDDVEARIQLLNKELHSQQAKLDRVTKQCSKLTKEIRSAKKTKEQTFEERDIDLKELKDLNRTVNKMLLEVMEEHPDLQAMLQMYFIQASLPLPSPASTPSSRSSKLSSARSSISLR
uniref:Coiled-coil domain-containing protein 39 n=1 Tax=Astyanax mexicanus TaxID=7994 RepID=A0A8B9HS65_ASTMX